MKIAYIKEEDKTCDIVKQMIIKIRRLFNLVRIQNVNEKIFIILPITNKTKIYKYQSKRLAKKVFKKLYDNYIENIVLSEFLSSNQILKNKLYEENINILDGRYLFKSLSSEIIKYIAKQKHKKLEEFGQISILVNDLDESIYKNILLIAREVKKLNIITNHIDKFLKIEEYLYNELGIIVAIVNNKQKSLIKSEIIINYDFPNELINKYNINNKAIIINIIDGIKIQSKKFSGICIKDLKLKLPKEYEISGFNKEIIYESIIYKKGLADILNKITKDKVKIKKLIGNNGDISNNEFRQINENYLTKL